MNAKIMPSEIGAKIAEKFRGREEITIYLGSNGATPTASLEALVETIKNDPTFPHVRMVHILLQGPAPHVEKGMEERITTYSMFSGGAVRDAANQGRAYYLPVTLVRIGCLVGKGKPFQADVVLMKVRKIKGKKQLSMGLSVEALPSAIDGAGLVIAELDPSMPFTFGDSILDPSSIDYLVAEGIQPVHALPELDICNIPNAEKRIGEMVTDHFIRNGCTLQVGIGQIPDAVVATIREGGLKHLGIQTEIYGDGLMSLQEEEIVTNMCKTVNRYSTTSLIMGSRKLYDFVDRHPGIQMRPCSYTNRFDTIQANAPFISINTAMGADLRGCFWADFVNSDRYYSGIGGQPDFVRALSDCAYGVPIIAIKSVTDKGQSKIVPYHPEGISPTATSYDGVVLVTEWGVADLRALAIGEKALAIAHVAHPDFREELLRHIVDSKHYTKPRGLLLDKTPKGVFPYDGDIAL